LLRAVQCSGEARNYGNENGILAMQAFDYLHFRIINSILFFNKKQKPNYRAVFILSMCVFFNIMMLTRGIFPLRGNYLAGLGIWGLIFFFLIRFLYSVDRYKRTLKRNYKNDPTSKIIWNALIIGYIILSILTLPMALN
jgi:hypothetical protein